MSKGEHERSVFVEFCRVASLPVDEGSVEVRTPPEPDIRCIMAGQPQYFELARLLDDEIPEERIEAFRRAPEPIKPRIGRIGLPERDILKRKLGKQYQTDGSPVDLLLYFDAESAVTAGCIPPIDFSEHVRAVMRPLLEASPRPFRRVWVYERYTPSILWSWPQ